MTIMVNLWEHVLSGEKSPEMVIDNKKEMERFIEICERAHNRGLAVLVPFKDNQMGAGNMAYWLNRSVPPMLVRRASVIEDTPDWLREEDEKDEREAFLQGAWINMAPGLWKIQEVGGDCWGAIAARLEALALEEEANPGAPRRAKTL